MRRLAPLFLLALVAIAGCGGGIIISDSISPAGPLNLAAGQSVTLTAMVVGDGTNSGVNWQLLGSGTLSAQTPTTVVYTSPSPVTAAGAAVVEAFPVKNSLYAAAVSVNYYAGPVFTTTGLPAATIGAAYSTQLGVSGGSSPITFALVSGTLPAGLTLSPSGLISGTPSVVGNATLTFSATDSSTKPVTITTTLTLVVNATPLILTTASVPNGVVGKAYSTTLTQTGGVSPYTWTISSGALASGLTLSNTGTISGSPSASGIYSFTVKVTDAEATPQVATKSYTMTVYTALAITTSSLPSGSVKNTYSTTLTASGGTQAYKWSLVSGTLPAGLSLSATTGVISGTPTTAGTSNITVQVADSSSPSQVATTSFSLNIVLSTLAITTTSLPGGTISASYNATLTSSGGNPPVTWSLAAGSVALPAGLGLSAGGVISGTPTTAGTTMFTVQATDATPASVTQTLSITVVALAPLTISTTSLAGGNIGTGYSATISATGGATPYMFTVTSGVLPPGLVLSTTGILSGTPVAAGSYTFTASVKDSETTPVTVTRQFTVSIGTVLAAGTNNAELAGGYAFLISGHAAGNTSGAVYGFGAIGSLTANAGVITGIEDINSATGVQTLLTVSGTYSLGTDNRGLMVLLTGTTTTVYAIAASNFVGGVAQSIALTEFDNATGSGNSGTGFALHQTAAALVAGSVKGTFAFGMSGESPCSSCATGLKFGPLVAVGIFTGDGISTLSGGQEDAAAYSTNYTGVTLAGSFTTPSTTTGRGTLKLTPTGTLFAAAPTDYTYVIVSTNELLLLSNDSHATTALLSGDVELQQQTAYSATSFSGRSIGYESQASGGDGSVTYPGALNATLTELTNTGSGTATFSQDSNRAGTFATTAATSIVYTTGTNGRTAITTGTGSNQVLYLYNTGTGFALDQAATSAYPGLVQYEMQTGAIAPFPVLLSGAYSADTIANPVPATLASGEDTFTLSTGGVNAGINGALGTTSDSSTTAGMLTLGQTASLLFAEDATGRISVSPTTTTTPSSIVYAITPKLAVQIGTGASAVPTVTVLQQ